MRSVFRILSLFRVTLLLKKPNCLCMHLRSGKYMARASSSSSQSSSQAQYLQATTPLGDLNVSIAVEATMAMPVLTETGVGLMIETQMCRTFLGNNHMVCQLR
jgi:hypothetical protein